MAPALLSLSAKRTFPLLLSVVLVACSTQHSTVHEGRFQKRHHRPGWHVDLHRATKQRPLDLFLRSEDVGPIRPTYFQPERPKAALIYASTTPACPAMSSIHVRNWDRPVVEQEPVMDTRPITKSSLEVEEELPERWNPWAIPAFVLALGAVAYGILGTSWVVQVLLVITALVIASIAIRKGRTWEWSGKGFAVAAMIIGCFAALITLIALLSGGA